MSLYNIKNLNKDSDTEVRIYRISSDGTLIPSVDFTNLDDLNANIGVKLKRNFEVDCFGALNYAGLISIDDAVGTELISTTGKAASVTDNVQFAVELNRLSGCEVYELEPWLGQEPS